MPKGPQGQKRPADAIARAVMVGRIATGEIEEAEIMPPDKDIRGRKGGEARARSLEPAKRSDIAKRAASSRWKTEREKIVTKKSERQTLYDRFQVMKAQGLTDMKFHLGKVNETTAEAVFAEVNRLLDNVEEGKVQEMPAWGDSRRKAVA